MGIAGLVLVTDDEHCSLQAMLKACREAGYECDSAGSVDETLDILPRKPYDLLVANLDLPGNFGLRIVHEVRSVAPGMPVIVTTKVPSLETAIEAVELPVVAYLIKPLDPRLLAQRISRVIQSRPGYRALGRVIETLRRCAEQLDTVRSEGAWDRDQGNWGPPIRALSACIVDLLSLGEHQATKTNASNLCAIVGCPRWQEHEAMFREVVRVLQETKRRFKSKELAELRDQLNQHLGILEK